MTARFLSFLSGVCIRLAFFLAVYGFAGLVVAWKGRKATR